ncbi:MAG TPA: FixH family protein, partial [Flavobacterium sp.]|nr:FixH family protein [Flavobacterium sp.]
ATNITGTVSLYRPSNQKLDFEIPISISDSHLLIPKHSLVGGRWDITVNWKYNEKEFLNSENIYFN